MSDSAQGLHARLLDMPETLSDDLLEQMDENRVSGWVNPYRCDDGDVIRRFPRSRDASTIFRPPFVRDIEKIIHLPAYNRLNGKTQVFSLRSNDDLSRRGLHVQLVSRIEVFGRNANP